MTNNYHTPKPPGKDVLAAIKDRFTLNDAGVVVVKEKYHCSPEVGEPVGSLNSVGYLGVRVLGKNCLIHHVAFFLHHNRWPGQQLDHLDGNKLNNHPANLEEVSLRENRSRYCQTATSLPLGVSWQKQRAKYKRGIWWSGRHIHLGHFQTPEPAGDAYQAALKLLQNGFKGTNRELLEAIGSHP